MKALSPNPTDRFAEAGDFATTISQSSALSLRTKGSPSGISRSCQLTAFIQKEDEQLKGETVPAAETANYGAPVPRSIDFSQDIIYVLMPDKTVKSFAMKSGGLTIGRSAENDISLDLSGVSRKHARIDFDGQNYLVRDLNSLNGTFLEKKG